MFSNTYSSRTKGYKFEVQTLDCKESKEEERKTKGIEWTSTTRRRQESHKVKTLVQSQRSVLYSSHMLFYYSTIYNGFFLSHRKLKIFF